MALQWHPVHEQFMHDNYGTIPVKELTKNFNKLFGTNISFKSIIGKASRMGLTFADKKPKEREAPSVGPKKFEVFKRAKPDKYKDSPAFHETRDGISIDELTETTCRWPIKQNHYCGQPNESKTYCSFHHLTSYKGYEYAKAASGRTV